MPKVLLEQKVLVIVPALNEQDTIGEVVREIRTTLPSADVLVIDDGSIDATADLAARAGASVLPLPVNLGYGAALQAGFKYAVRHDYDLIAQVDGDGQHPPAQLRRLLTELKHSDVDIVIGSRFLDGEGHYQPTLARRTGMVLFSWVASRFTAQHISDPTSGFQFMRKRVAEFFCTTAYPNDYPDADILILLHRSGFRMKEVPVQMVEQSGPSMHSGHRSIYYAYKMTLSTLFAITSRRQPKHEVGKS